MLNSGGVGRHHLWVFVRDRLLRAKVRELMKLFGWDVRRDVRPPLAPHRQGFEVSVWQGTILDLVMFFTDTAGTLDGRTGAKTGCRGVNYSRLLAEGDPEQAFYRPKVSRSTTNRSGRADLLAPTPGQICRGGLGDPGRRHQHGGRQVAREHRHDGCGPGTRMVDTGSVAARR